MTNLPKNRSVLFATVAAALVVILLVGIAWKDNFTVRKLGVPKEGQTPAQEAKLARAVNFGGIGEKPEFSIRPPQGWAKGEIEQQVDLVVGSLTPEKLPNGTNFTTNIVASISPHPIPASGIADYQASWKEYMLNQFPSMEVVGDGMASVGGMDAYVLEMKQTRSDGAIIHQLQYVFYVDSKYALGITASVPENAWDEYEKVIRASLKSLKKIDSEH